MDVGFVVHVHDHEQTVRDTVDSIRHHAGSKILLCVDGNSDSWARRQAFGAPYIVGLRNQSSYALRTVSSYRNVCLGLRACRDQYPGCDWYCSLEYDVLLGSSRFLDDLASLPPEIGCVGFCHRRMYMHLPLLDVILRRKCREQRYLLGCCIFFSGAVMDSICGEGLIDRILSYTNGFDQGFFPGYWEQNGYDFMECLLPTMAHRLGAEIHSFSEWDSQTKTWRGNSRHYPVRWPDELELDEQCVRTASIMHPVKRWDTGVREMHRERRKEGCTETLTTIR